MGTTVPRFTTFPVVVSVGGPLGGGGGVNIQLLVIGRFQLPLPLEEQVPLHVPLYPPATSQVPAEVPPAAVGGIEQPLPEYGGQGDDGGGTPLTVMVTSLGPFVTPAFQHWSV